MSLRAISIRQPYAFLIVRPDIFGDENRKAAHLNGEFKDIENRSRWTSFRGEVMIHASLQPADNYKTICLDIWNTFGIRVPPFEELKSGGIIGRAMFCEAVEESDSPWFSGPYGYPIFSVEPIRFVACKGALGFWNVPPEIRLAA